MEKYQQKDKLFKSWFWIAYIPLFIILLVHFAKHPEELTLKSPEFWLILLGTLLPLALLLAMRFELSVNVAEIRYRYFPLQWKTRVLSWKHIKSARMVKFNPVRHYLGYGYRKSKKYGHGFVVQGDIGLLVTDLYGNRINFEITNKHDFESFVTRHNLQQVDLKIVKLEETI
jgi:hypothetical protein